MAYQNLSQSTPAPLKTLRVIYFALLAGQCLFLMVTLSITPNKVISFSTADPLIFVAPILALIAIISGPIISSKVLKGAKDKITVREKLSVYQSAFIMRAALLEGTCLFAIVSFMISGNLFYVVVAGVLILIYLTTFPTNDKVVTALGLSTGDLEAEV
jgi:hypothetical protein